VLICLKICTTLAYSPGNIGNPFASNVNVRINIAMMALMYGGPWYPYRNARGAPLIVFGPLYRCKQPAFSEWLIYNRRYAICSSIKQPLSGVPV
jgi:hypothetical protein